MKTPLSARYDGEHLAYLKKRLVFQVEETPPGIPLSGLPCFAPYGYSWTLPSMGPESDFAIGWEMGLAYLRLKRLPGGAVHPEQMDPCPLDLDDLMTVLNRPLRKRGMVYLSDGYRKSFLACIGAFNDHALNAPHTLPGILGRLDALDNAALRARCLAILDGKPVPDVFAPEGLGWAA